MQARRFRVYAAVTHIELWRRGWDLNPRYPLRYVRFRGGSFQPLTHLSGVGKVGRSRRKLAYTYILATTSKKRLHHLRATAREHSPANLDLVVHFRMIHYLHYRMHGAGLRIIRAIYQAL